MKVRHPHNDSLVDFPPGSGNPKYWMYRKYGKYEVQYNRSLHQYGWDKIKQIADKTINTCDIWETFGKHSAETGSLDGVMYISFAMRNPDGEITVCIETQEAFEKTLGVRLADIAEHTAISDGQHKHEGVKHGDGKS